MRSSLKVCASFSKLAVSKGSAFGRRVPPAKHPIVQPSAGVNSKTV